MSDLRGSRRELSGRHSSAHRTGVYMGILNFFVVVPEILASLSLARSWFLPAQQPPVCGGCRRSACCWRGPSSNRLVIRKQRALWTSLPKIPRSPKQTCRPRSVSRRVTRLVRLRSSVGVLGRPRYRIVPRPFLVRQEHVCGLLSVFLTTLTQVPRAKITPIFDYLCIRQFCFFSS